MSWDQISFLDEIQIINEPVGHFEGLKYYMATGDLSNENTKDLETVNFENKPSRASLTAQIGDIIFARMKCTNKVLRVNEHERDYIFSTGFVVIRHSNNINGQYLLHYFKSNLFQQEKDKLCTGATQKAINNQNLEKLKIPLPPLEIQKCIADILDAADALRQKDQELLKKYDELAQAIFIDMFGDPVKNEKGWEVKNIENLVSSQKHSIKRGPFGGALKKEIFIDKGYLVYEQFHALNNDFDFARYYINEDKYQELIAFDVKPKDIIISCSGVYLGKLAIVPDNAKPGIISQALLKLTLDETKYKNAFFVSVFTQENFKEKYFASERGAGIPNFPPMSTFKEFKFICPPIALQEKYLAKINLIKHQKGLVKNTHSDKLFLSLLQKAFNDQLAL